MSEPAKERKPMSKKKKIILAVVLGLAVLLIALGTLLRGCSLFNKDLEPILDTSFCIYFPIYTNSSMHGGDTPYYCVTDDGYFLLPSRPATYIKLSSTELEAEAFYALFDRQASIPGHWQGDFDGVECSPESIYKRCVRAWYGENERKDSTGFVYILELNNGIWLIAQGWDVDGIPTLCFVDKVKSVGSQDAFFDFWHEHFTHKSYDWEFIFLKYGYHLK